MPEIFLRDQEHARIGKVLSSSRFLSDKRLGAAFRAREDKKGIVDVAASLLSPTMAMIAGAEENHRTAEGVSHGLGIVKHLIK
jgi:hypothetical protein